MDQLFVQALGFVAMAMCIGCFICKNSKHLLFLQLWGNILFIIHFVLLGAYSGCMNMLILVACNMVILLRMRGRTWAAWRGWPWLFCVITAAIAMATWEDYFTLLPCVATMAFVLANWTGNAMATRLAKLTIVGIGWVIYNYHVHSYSGTINELIGMCSALGSMIYYHRSRAEAP